MGSLRLWLTTPGATYLDARAHPTKPGWPQVERTPPQSIGTKGIPAVLRGGFVLQFVSKN